MRTLLKILAYVVVGFIGLILLLSLAAYFLFDPNEQKADIEDGIRDVTGRDFSIEGDLSLSVFPRVAVDVGRTTLGNAEGFGDEPFVAFDSARVSIKVLPLIFNDELAIGTASLEGLRINLAVDETGRTNWDDLAERQEAAEQFEEEIQADEDDGTTVTVSRDLKLDIASIAVVDAAFAYVDREAGSAYSLSDVNLETGRITGDRPIPIEGGFSFSAEPDAIAGRVDLDVIADFNPESGDVGLKDFELALRIEGVTEAPADIRFTAADFRANTEQQTVDPGAIGLSVFDLELVADVEPFSYAGSVEPKASLSIAAFSPRSLLTTLGAEVPETADPGALELLRLDAKADVSDERIALDDIVIVIDDTTFRGKLNVPRDATGSYELDLAGDSIDLNRYMAPADTTDEATADDEAPPAEIPAELIRPINARGSLTMDEALMGSILFENVELELNLADGKMRLHPFSSELFDGEYQGDVRLDVSGDTPVLSVNEQLKDVSLAPLGKAMLEAENLTGLINGSFVLSGTGHDMAEIQQTLNGNIAFELKDGTYEGTDVWYELRRARALIRRVEPPTPDLPPRTRFSEVSATGQVVNGVLNNDDFRADLPFMQLTGQGSVDLVAETLDYSLRGRVFDKPELMGSDVSQAEIDDFTRAVLPLRISGSLTDPKFSLDFEEAAKEAVEEEVKDRLRDLINRELGGDEADPDQLQEGEEEEKDVEDVLKDRLRDLLKKDED